MLVKKNRRVRKVDPIYDLKIVKIRKARSSKFLLFALKSLIETLYKVKSKIARLKILIQKPPNLA